MKKIVSMLLAATVMLSMAGCGSNGEKAKDDGVLRVGMECNYAPYNWSQSDESNGAVPIKNVDKMYTNGYDVQVAKKSRIPWEKRLRFIPMNGTALFRAYNRENLI